ncbi:hypothetical protein CBS101457_002459 [Exobasidium rhododendri]|nr:hypothetical protein CBS101457_002459 [Exobasidium rhododendri]
MRALDWSLKRLQKAAKVRREDGNWKIKTRLDPNISPFGYSETSYRDAITQLMAAFCAVYLMTSLDIPAALPGGFYGMPMYQQLSISAAMGILVSFPGDLPELLSFPVLQRWPFNLPCTAITPHFRNVVRSKTLTDLWSFQWHGFLRRDVMRLGFLLPIAKNNRIMILLKSFFWSAVFHSFIFVRVRPDLLFSWLIRSVHGSRSAGHCREYSHLHE